MKSNKIKPLCNPSGTQYEIQKATTHYFNIATVLTKTAIEN